jgi:flagellar hook-associated protein 3 FlgL
MRVSTQTIYRNISYNILTITEQLRKINEQIASSRRINRPSDDPVGLTHALNLRESLAQIEQYGANIKLGQSWLQMTESALQQVNDLTIRAKTVAAQMATGTYTANERKNAAKEIQNIIEQMVQIGNTKLSGRYIFGGDKDRTAPYGTALTVHSAEAASTNNPAYTGTATSSGTYTGLYSKQYVVEITTGGVVGVARYKVSEDGGVTWGPDDAFTTSTDGSGVYAGAHTTVTQGTGWSGTSTVSASGNGFTGSKALTYAFTVPTVTLNGSNAEVRVDWTDSDGGSGTLTIPANYTPGEALEVEDGLTVSFGAGTLVSGDAFTVEVSPVSLEIPPNQGVKIAFTDSGTLTVGDRFIIEVSQYNGDADAITVNIGQTAQININLHGEAVFGQAGDSNGNLFDILAGLKHALEQNDQEGVQQSLERLSAVQVNHTSNMADVGSRLNRLEVTQNILSDLDANHTTRLSGIEDIDITQASRT